MAAREAIIYEINNAEGMVQEAQDAQGKQMTRSSRLLASASLRVRFFVAILLMQSD